MSAQSRVFAATAVLLVSSLAGCERRSSDENVAKSSPPAAPVKAEVVPLSDDELHKAIFDGIDKGNAVLNEKKQKEAEQLNQYYARIEATEKARKDIESAIMKSDLGRGLKMLQELNEAFEYTILFGENNQIHIQTNIKRKDVCSMGMAVQFEKGLYFMEEIVDTSRGNEHPIYETAKGAGMTTAETLGILAKNLTLNGILPPPSRAKPHGRSQEEIYAQCVAK